MAQSTAYLQELTLIDLPGITQVKTTSQAQDVPQLTRSMVKKYMAGACICCVYRLC